MIAGFYFGFACSLVRIGCQFKMRAKIKMDLRKPKILAKN
jgi:hypothetical protein